MLRRFAAFELGVNLEIVVRIEAGKLVVALGIRNLGPNVVGFLVVQVDDSIRYGILVFVHHASVNRPQLGTVTIVLGANRNSGEDKHGQEKRYRRRNPSGSQLGSPWCDSFGNRSITP